MTKFLKPFFGAKTVLWGSKTWPWNFTLQAFLKQINIRRYGGTHIQWRVSETFFLFQEDATNYYMLTSRSETYHSIDWTLDTSWHHNRLSLLSSFWPRHSPGCSWCTRTWSSTSWNWPIPAMPTRSEGFSRTCLWMRIGVYCVHRVRRWPRARQGSWAAFFWSWLFHPVTSKPG